MSNEDNRRSLDAFSAGLRAAAARQPEKVTTLSRDGDLIADMRRYLGDLAMEASKVLGSRWEAKFGSNVHHANNGTTSFRVALTSEGSMPKVFDVIVSEHWIDTCGEWQPRTGHKRKDFREAMSEAVKMAMFGDQP